MGDTFRDAMRLMRKHNPQLQEDGFHLLRPHAAEHVDALVAEFQAERDDHGLRCWLLELIGEARSEAARPVLMELLTDEDEAFRGWAERGLELLVSKESRR
ncbi:HEAT repeat domain-containing protein [Kutzneria sp. CA-103260]|uniref:HEAT repeat domain-containing protein n=1 Tax=Kutzneria sp. CA-103260 TaxID=2802641 RepID=UPI001BAB133F|nr:HEAT repeat domain-containing protein [Kutzneria sp. CA-103260]QUQ70560.1 hypothetical protein JJ691_83390 [Kutzneria sp. CA-103260]